MKKLFIAAVCLLATLTTARAGDDKPIRLSDLPVEAQTFIKTHFADNKVSLAKMETEFLDKTYEVIFTNGDKVEFDKKGVWKEVECKQGRAVPADIVPAALRKQVAERYPDAAVLKIEQDKYEYELQLSNRLELKFDKKFNLIDIDD